MRNCKKCKVTFQPKTSRQVFCGKKCSRNFSQMNLKKRNSADPAKKHYSRNRCRETKATLVAYAGGSCKDCLGVFAPCCYHFDHRVPADKLFDVGSRITCSIDLLKPEVDKCDLVCANCHAIRTFGNEAVSDKIKAGQPWRK